LNVESTGNEINPTSLDRISNLIIVDVGDLGNGADLQVSFSKVNDETNVLEYRIFVVNSDQSANFTIETAAGISMSNLFIAAKTGSNISVNLLEDSKTTTGELISNDVPYKIFVMTVTNNPQLHFNALSAPSAEFALGPPENRVKVTYIANDGVMIEFEDKKVMIDGMNRAGNLSGWISPTNTEYMMVENGEPPYNDIDVIMITHNHGDHYSISAVQNYLTDHPNTKLIVPTSVEANFGGFANQIVDFSINKFERINLVENEISIDVLQIEHFDQFGNDFSMVESFAYIITMNGKKFFHTGDIDYIDSQLDGFDLLADDISVVFIPTFGDLVTATNRDAIIDNVAPDVIVCLHFLVSGMTTTLQEISNIYPPDVVTFTTPFQIIEY
jgi:L-ascorbate metabolism protein UlaG (beta-lactamase superfamily)